MGMPWKVAYHGRILTASSLAVKHWAGFECCSYLSCNSASPYAILSSLFDLRGGPV